jgi:hypothetical protein
MERDALKRLKDNAFVLQYVPIRPISGEHVV